MSYSEQMIDIPDFVYPKDAQGNALCPRCQKIVKDCACPVKEAPKPKAPKIMPYVRLDKSGRRGKVVTVIERLPRDERYLKELSKKLKVKTGSGGTFYMVDDMGVVEIQGDHKKIIEQIL